MSRDIAYEFISSQSVAVPTGSALAITCAPGQVGVLINLISGGSLELGGSSLASGAGQLMVAGSGSALQFFPFDGTLYGIATGSTAICRVTRYITSGNPASLG